MNKCLGCGVNLQNDDPNADGFVSSSDFNLCVRCFKIKNYGVNSSVSKNNTNYIKIIDNIGDGACVIYVASLLTLNLNYIDKFSKVILVLTKRDVIPKSVKDGKIINYIKKRYNNVLDVIIVSAKKKKNLDCLYNKICTLDTDSIYFVGATNSGKSTLINELIKDYGDGDSIITISAFPSTTLDVIPKKIGNKEFYDTPGLVNDNSIINSLSVKNIKKINSKCEIKPTTFQINGEGSIMVGDIFRINYSTVESSLTFYMSNELNVRSISKKNEIFNNFKSKSMNVSNNQDVVIDDIGFIKITKDVKLTFYYEDKFDVWKRDNLI